MPSLFSLEGRRALVTGAGQSVGRGIATQLARAGAHVAVNDLHADRAEATASLISEDGGIAYAAAYDVADPVAVADGIAKAEAALGGPLDILVNNAGIPEGGRSVAFVDSEPADWQAYFDLNVFASLRHIRALLPGMRDRGWGRIIQISSGTGSRPVPGGVSIYAASKAGIEGAIRFIGYENAAAGVTANSLALGLMENVAAQVGDSESAVNAILAAVPMKRLGKPTEVGAAAVWLCSEEGGFVCGQTIHVNGGSFSGR